MKKRVQPTTFIEPDIETGHSFGRHGRWWTGLIGVLNATRSGWWRRSQPPSRTMTSRIHAKILLCLILHLLIVLIVLM